MAQINLNIYIVKMKTQYDLAATEINYNVCDCEWLHNPKSTLGSLPKVGMNMEWVL